MSLLYPDGKRKGLKTAQLLRRHADKAAMRISIPLTYQLLPSPIGSGSIAAAHLTAEGLQLSPVGNDCFINQGDDPPSKGGGPRRRQFATLYGAESARLHESIASEQLKQRVQTRQLKIASLLRDGKDYAAQLDEFERGFDFDVEIKALHRLVEGDWAEGGVEQALGDKVWMIQLMAVKAYVTLHTELLSVTIDHQRAALAVLRGWLRHSKKTISGSVLTNYKALIDHITQNPDSLIVSDVLAKEIKALEKSLETGQEDDIATGLERQALEFIQAKAQQ